MSAKTQLTTDDDVRISLLSRTACEQLDCLIAHVKACEQALIAARAQDVGDLIFVDDYSRLYDDMRANAEALATSPSLDLAARYSATMKAAVAILLKLRELESRGRTARRDAPAL